MTPTTASPSLVQLNPTAPIAKPSTPADAGAAPDAASSSFEQLLGTARQLHQKQTKGADQSDTASKNSEKSIADSGNGLPLSGLILPLTALSQAASDAAAQADTASTTKSQDEKDQDAIAATDLMLPVVAMPPAPMGLIIQPRVSADNSAITASADASAAALAGKDIALAAQSRSTADIKADAAANKATVLISSADSNATTDGAKVVASTDTTSMAATANAIASMFTGGGNSADVNVGVKAAGPLPTAGANSVSAAVGVNADMTATAAAFVKEVQGASKHLVESDFDALVKHFDASNNQPTLSAATISGGANTHQAAGTYANAASNNTSVSVPVGSNGWSDAVADKVMWFSANNISSAEIHLNPPDLGPLQVRVSTQHDQASIVFTSQHAAVRDALDQALPRLREMMGSQGMHLLDVSVGGQSAQQQQQQFARNNPDRGNSSSGFFADDSAQTVVTNVTTINTARLTRSGVDAYA